jgi:hypothetical protein
MPLSQTQAMLHGTHADQLPDPAIAVYKREGPLFLRHANHGTRVQPASTQALHHMAQATGCEGVEAERVA